MGLVLELREEIVNVLVRGTKGVEGENLENKTGWLEGGEKRQVSLFFFFLKKQKRYEKNKRKRKGKGKKIVEKN